MPESADRYVRTKFELSATIGGHVFDHIVSISMTFSLNDIPEAILIVPTGYRADRYGEGGDDAKAKIHSARKSLKSRDVAEVRLKITPTDGDTSKTESGEFVIFRGYLMGIGYQRAHNQMNYMLTLVHWLDDLNNSSGLNGNWFPNVPHDYGANAAFIALTQSGDGTSFSSVPIVDAKGDIVSQTRASTDLWDLVIKPIFEKIANFPLNNGGPNDKALEALKRMPKVSNAPLALNLDGLEILNIDMSLRHALSINVLESFAYTTFWAKLIREYAAQFFFAVSPAIEKAYVVPFFGGLQWAEPAKTISSDEYNYANFDYNMKSLVEQIQMFWPAGTDPMLGGGGLRQVEGLFKQPLATYPPGGGEKRGLKMFKDPPEWIANIAAWPLLAAHSAGITDKQPGDTFVSQVGNGPPPNVLIPSAAAAILRDSKVMERFAHHWFKTEFLGQRIGNLSGKLRFDIAPGSTVRIEMPPLDRQNGLGDAQEYMMGVVTQVSCAINAERAVAGTGLSLAYVRTDEEDRRGEITAPFAPVYESEKWYGAPLKG